MRVIAVAFAAVAAAQSGPDLILNTCSAAAAKYQQFQVYKTTSIILSATAGDNPPKCVDIANFNTNPGAEGTLCCCLGRRASHRGGKSLLRLLLPFLLPRPPYPSLAPPSRLAVYTWPCGDGSGKNEAWTITASSIASQQTPSTCLAAEVGEVQARVTTAACSSTDPLQQLAYSAATQLIVHVPSGLCVDAGTPLPPEQWCQKPAQANWTVCNPNAALDDRAADIVSRLSLADKIAALGTGTPYLPSVSLPAYQWWSEGAWGVLLCVCPPLCSPTPAHPLLTHPHSHPLPAALRQPRTASAALAWGTLTSSPRAATLSCPSPARAALIARCGTLLVTKLLGRDASSGTMGRQRPLFGRQVSGCRGGCAVGGAAAGGCLPVNSHLCTHPRARRAHTHARSLLAQSSTLSGTRAGVRPLAPASPLHTGKAPHLTLSTLPRASRRKEP